MSPTILFTHLKIILLQYFQFSATISSIQTDPKKFQIQIGQRLCDKKKKKKKFMLILDEKATSQCQTTRWGRRHFHQKLKWVFFFFAKFLSSLYPLYLYFPFTSLQKILRYFISDKILVLYQVRVWIPSLRFQAAFCSFFFFFFFTRFGVLQLLFNKQ